MIIEICIIIIVGYVLLFSQGESPPKNQLRYPKVYLLVGIVSLLFWLFFLLLVIINNIPIYKSVFSTLTLLGFIIISLIIVISYFNIYTIYDDESFTHSNFFRIKKTIYYSDIKLIYKKSMLNIWFLLNLADDLKQQPSTAQRNIFQTFFVLQH